MSTHTPGPWVVECDKFIATPDAIVIAELNDGLRGEYPKSGHFNANAQLIAAAPELLEQLKLAYRMLLQTNWIHEDEAMNELLAVIRKAEGI